MLQHRFISRLLALPAATLLLATGCSSISVQPRHQAANPGPAPRRLVVADFTFPSPAPGSVRVDRQGADLQLFERHLSTALRGYLAQDLARFGLPVQQAPRGHVPPGPNGWLVNGQFLRVNQGSRALRVVVGLGSGGTKMVTRVDVTEIGTGHSVVAFRTTGGSNADTGIITSAGPLTVATGGLALINVAGSSAHGVTEDAKRTAKMIADYISQQLAQRGYIPAEKARKPKILAGSVDPLGSLKN